MTLSFAGPKKRTLSFAGLKHFAGPKKWRIIFAGLYDLHFEGPNILQVQKRPDKGLLIMRVQTLLGSNNYAGLNVFTYAGLYIIRVFTFQGSVINAGPKKYTFLATIFSMAA